MNADVAVSIMDTVTPARYTYEESITDNPGWVSSARSNLGAKAKVKDSAKTLAGANAAKVHVGCADGPSFATERERDRQGTGAC